MRAVLQRVSSSSVLSEGVELGSIGPGLLVLLGIEAEDTQAEIKKLINKIIELRIFADTEGRFNESLRSSEGEILVVSQFTLYADCSKGRRPSFTGAARPETAIPLYEEFLARLEEALPQKVACGRFGADMQVSLVNDGPVTIMLDTANT